MTPESGHLDFRTASRTLFHLFTAPKAQPPTESDCAAVLAWIEALMDAERNTPRGDELRLLSLLVHDYEEKTFPIAKPDPVEAIRFRMEQQGLKPTDLVPFLGSRSRVSEVLSGRRNLTLKMIRALVRVLGIPADVLLG